MIKVTKVQEMSIEELKAEIEVLKNATGMASVLQAHMEARLTKLEAQK